MINSYTPCFKAIITTFYMLLFTHQFQTASLATYTVRTRSRSGWDVVALFNTPKRFWLRRHKRNSCRRFLLCIKSIFALKCKYAVRKINASAWFFTLCSWSTSPSANVSLRFLTVYVKRGALAKCVWTVTSRESRLRDCCFLGRFRI